MMAPWNGPNKYPCGVEATLREDVVVGVGDGRVEVALAAGRLLLEPVERVAQLRVGRVAREAERRRRRLRELDDGKARQRRRHVEPVLERRQEAADRRELGERERAVDEDGDVQRRVERVVHAACQAGAQRLDSDEFIYF